MAYFKANDTISGQEARAYMVVGKQTEEMFFAKSLTAFAQKEKTKIRTLGKRGVQYKATGWVGTGKMVIYYATSKFRELMVQYMDKGEDVYFDIQVINEDPSSGVGKQTVLLKNVNLDKVTIAAFDAGAEALEEEVAFTFDGVEVLDKFIKPILG